MAKNNFHRDSIVWSATSTEVQASQGQAAQFYSSKSAHKPFQICFYKQMLV